MYTALEGMYTIRTRTYDVFAGKRAAEKNGLVGEVYNPQSLTRRPRKRVSLPATHLRKR